MTTQQERRRVAAEIRARQARERGDPASQYARRRAWLRARGLVSDRPRPTARRGLDSPGMVRWRADRGLTRDQHRQLIGVPGGATNALARSSPEGATVTPLHTGTSPGRRLVGYGARFDNWTEINSPFEGNFLEKIARGAFTRSINSGARPKVQFDHGRHPLVGSLPLGGLDVLAEDAHGLRYEVDLLAADYVDGYVLPPLRAGLLGSSFRFAVPDGGDSWTEPTRATKWNPKKLPERTLRDVELFELGPVVFPAYKSASAGIGE